MDHDAPHPQAPHPQAPHPQASQPQASHHTPLIEAWALAARLGEVFVVDCSHDLAAPDAGRAAWADAHIPGAIHAHLDHDLAAPPGGGRGRHPLPDRDALAAMLAARGLRRGQQVVAYDRSQGPFAARLWWLLRWLGHDAVAVLDGGWDAWLAAGGAVEHGAPAGHPSGDFAPEAPRVGVVDTADVVADLASRRHLIVDARAPSRYRGEDETLDPVGGHIPGAVCRFFRDNLGADGRFKPAAELRAEWDTVLAGRAPTAMISQCGSGVTACHNLLALDAAGLPGALLYPGSWSAWCSDPARPVRRGPQPG